MNSIKSVIRALTKENTILAYVLAGLFAVRILSVLVSFANIVLFDDIIRPKTIYELGGGMAKVFLILAFLSVLFLLKKTEAAFIPLEIICNVVLLGLLSGESDNVDEYNRGFLPSLQRGFHRFFSADPYAESPGDLKMAGSYTFLRIFVFLGFALVILYLYFRIARKIVPDRTPMMENLNMAGLLNAVSFHKVLAAGALLIMIAPFFTYIRGDMKIFTYYGFSSRPYAAFIAFLAGFLILRALSKQSMQYVPVYIGAALLTLLRLHPFYILHYGKIGFGYVLYIAALILMVLSVTLLRRQQNI